MVWFLQVFRGDPAALSTAYREARAAYEAKRHIDEGEELVQAVKDAAEAADFLAHHVVQANLNERGNYEVKIDEQHLGDVVHVQTAADRAAELEDVDAAIRKEEEGCCGGDHHHDEEKHERV